MIFSIWIAAIIIQVSIVLLLSVQFVKYKKNIANPGLKLSVIIAARNEEDNLQKLLPALLNQTHPNFEVIVALDRCTDNSAKLLRKFEGKIRSLKISEIPSNYNGKKYALEQAIKVSKGDWLVFTDADCFPTSGRWLSELSSKMEGETQIVLGLSPYLEAKTLLASFIRYEAFITGFHYLSMSLLKKAYMGVGRNMAIKKSLFESSNGYKGFSSRTGGDDDLFIQQNATKTNTAIILGNDSLVITYPQKTWSNYFQQKTRHLGVGDEYSKFYQFLHVLFNGTLLLVWALIPFISLEIILPIILFYLIVKSIGYRFAQTKMKAGFNYMLLPLVELMYAVILPMIALRSKLVKDIRWKN